MTTFISYRRSMRSWRTAVEILATSVIAIGAWAFGGWRLIADLVNQSSFGAIGILVGIVSAVIAIIQTVGFVRGAEYSVEIKEAGITVNGEQWAWKGVTRIRSTLKRATKQGFMNITVQRQGSPSLTHLVDITGEQPETGLFALQEFLSSHCYRVRWELRVY